MCCLMLHTIYRALHAETTRSPQDVDGCATRSEFPLTLCDAEQCNALRSGVYRWAINGCGLYEWLDVHM